jgi:hypothetical protein
MAARQTAHVKLRDIALRIPPMLGYDHLHFGYWEGLEINAGGSRD